MLIGWSIDGPFEVGDTQNMAGRKDEAVARTYFEDFAGKDFVEPVMHAIGCREQLGDEGAIASMGPSWATLSPEIEFDLAPVAGAGVVYNGFSGFLDYWNEWLGLWDEYVYEIERYAPMGGWIVAEVVMRAKGRAGMSLEERVAQACEIRDGKIVRMRAFPTMAEAEKSLGRPRRGIRGAIERRLDRS